MTNSEPMDETDLLRRELRTAGFTAQRSPEEFGLELRMPESFTRPSDTQRRVTDPRPPRWVRPLLFGSVAASVAAAATVAVLGTPASEGGRSDTDRPHHPTSAPELMNFAKVLGRAGRAAGAESDRTDVDAYWRVETLVQDGTAPAHERSVWLGRGREGLLVEDGRRTVLRAATFGLAKSVLSWDELRALPHDADQLRTLLTREVRSAYGAEADDEDYRVAKLAGELLSEAPTPPGVRRAAWEVLAQLPGAVPVGRVTDAAGRTGEGVQFSRPRGQGQVVTYVVDVRTGAMLEVRHGSASNDSEFVTTHLTRGPADTLPG